MYQGKTEEREYISKRMDSAEHLAFSLMYSNIQFRQKKPSPYLDEKGKFIILGTVTLKHSK